ncbi:MAG TPA: hypothetical protein EYG93_04490, partial [Sulfurospirillum arcachonense]|nr:hypothetical protein [Sulfurospirillum arcachonense]
MVYKLNSDVSYEEIIKNIWYSENIPTATLRSLVRRVRKLYYKKSLFLCHF